MLNKTKMSAVLLTLGLATTATSHAAQTSLESYIGNMLAQSIVSVQQELNNNTQDAVLTAAKKFSLFTEQTYATKTSIIDLNVQIAQTAQHEKHVSE
jgi:regulator of protease activity HflC (stomatin/prohibitin superfamily)